MKKNLLPEILKIIKVFESCITEEHHKAALKMLENYEKKIEHEYNTVKSEIIKNEIIGPALNKYKKALILLCFPILMFSQINYTRTELIQEKGKPDAAIYINKEHCYIYNQITYTKESGQYTTVTAYYFRNNRCYMIEIYEPITELSSNIIYLNQNAINMGDLKWINNNNAFYIGIRNGYCVTTIMHK